MLPELPSLIASNKKSLTISNLSQGKHKHILPSFHKHVEPEIIPKSFHDLPISVRHKVSQMSLESSNDTTFQRSSISSMNQKRLIEAIEIHQSKIQSIDSEIESSIESCLDSFKNGWSVQSEEFQKILKLFHSEDSLSTTTFADITEVIEAEVEIFEDRKRAVVNLEHDLQEFEKQRITLIGESLIKLGQCVATIRFESPSFATRLVHEETISLNLKSIDNRRKIIAFSSMFEAINSETRLVFHDALGTIKQNWKTVRFEKVFNDYEQDLGLVSLSVSDIISKFQDLFDENRKSQIKHVDNI